jgi:zinc transport system substrate-binding protein
MSRPLRLAWVLGIGACLVGACGPPPGGEGRPRVVVSVPPQAWPVDRLAGDLVETVVMIPPGASPATYEPTLAQMQAVARAALYLRLGHPAFPFEHAWLDRVLGASESMRVVTVLDEAATSAPNPHAWVVPRHMRTMAERTARALAELLPECERAGLETRRRALLEEIDATNAAVAERRAGARGRTVVTFHPAWEPLAREYGLSMLAIEREGKEPDARELARLIERIGALGPPVIFTQPQFDDASVRVVAEAVGARVEPADPLARDWPGNLLDVARRFAEAAR